MKRVLAIVLTAAIVLTPTASVASVAAPARPTKVIATIGDSQTALGRYQAELCRLMLQDAGVQCSIVNPSIQGTRCDYWPSLIGGVLATYHPDVVIVYCGTNDAAPTALDWPLLDSSWRTIVEASHASTPRPVIVPTLIGYQDPLIWPMSQLGAEVVVNWTLYAAMQSYPANWFAGGIVDLQNIGSDPKYIDGTGVHYTERGYRYVGRKYYDALAVAFGWPASSEPPLCDLYGHAHQYGTYNNAVTPTVRPSYVLCA